MRWDEWYQVVCESVAEAVALAKIPAAQSFTGADSSLQVYVGDGNLRQIPFIRVVMVDWEPTETQQRRDTQYTKRNSITTKDLPQTREYISFGLFVTSHTQVQVLKITQAIIAGLGIAGTLTDGENEALFTLGDYTLQAAEDIDGNINRYSTTLTLKLSVVSNRSYSHTLIPRIKNVINTTTSEI